MVTFYELMLDAIERFTFGAEKEDALNGLYDLSLAEAGAYL